jgi:peptidoglycan/LPS O-acetylase OafA/YrhL
MARILPVSLAAIFLSIAISAIVGNNEVPNGGSMDFSWGKVWINLLFLGQSWNNSLFPYNPPFWTLNYEVWYYIIFGAWVYIPSRVPAFVAAIIAGAKIILLFPVWLTGVFIYKKMPLLRKQCASRIFIITAISGLIFFWFDLAVQIRELMKVIWPNFMAVTHGSGTFFGDFILGIIVAVNFIAAANMDMKILLRCEPAIRKFSGFTFSIYLFHMPLAIFIWNGIEVHAAFLFYSLLALGVFLLGLVTEKKTGSYYAMFQRFPVSKKALGLQSLH